jgi:hypothetical protein
MLLIVFDWETERKSGDRARRALRHRFYVLRAHAHLSCFLSPQSHTCPMDDLEELRKLVGPEANDWTTAKLAQLSHDMDAMAALFLDLYRSRNGAPRGMETRESRIFDVPQADW